MSHAIRLSDGDPDRDPDGDPECERVSAYSEVQSVVTRVKYPIALYVDRVTRQWVVRDPDRNFWLLPADDNGWQHRQPFHLTEDTDLEVVPGHYQYMFNLPF
jgi:hypothetical protein